MKREPVTRHQRMVARRLAANLCIRDGKPLAPEEIRVVQRCAACRADETTKAKARYHERKAAR